MMLNAEQARLATSLSGNLDPRNPVTFVKLTHGDSGIGVPESQPSLGDSSLDFGPSSGAVFF